MEHSCNGLCLLIPAYIGSPVFNGVKPTSVWGRDGRYRNRINFGRARDGWSLLAPTSTYWWGDPVVLTLALSPPFSIRVVIATRDSASGSSARVCSLKYMPVYPESVADPLISVSFKFLTPICLPFSPRTSEGWRQERRVILPSNWHSFSKSDFYHRLPAKAVSH